MKRILYFTLAALASLTFSLNVSPAFAENDISLNKCQYVSDVNCQPSYSEFRNTFHGYNNSKLNVNQLKNASRNHGINKSALKEKLPGNLEIYGNEPVLNFLKDKHLSHIKSQKNAPSSKNDPNNVIWEVGKNNIKRGSRNMTAFERSNVGIHNHIDAFKSVLKSSNARSVLASNTSLVGITSSAIYATYELLLNKRAFINGSEKERMEILSKVASKTAVHVPLAVGVSAGVSLAALAIPGVAMCLPPLAAIGITMQAYELLKAALA
ncbi:MAG: hypothetical protein OXF25_01745 [Cyanobacteria bacterium MAG CAR3_bin_5]|nr:hypothetical protein [Cyanobacteria bacterium MAG CAR3_bin_5]